MIMQPQHRHHHFPLCPPLGQKDATMISAHHYHPPLPLPLPLPSRHPPLHLLQFTFRGRQMTTGRNYGTNERIVALVFLTMVVRSFDHRHQHRSYHF
jgi:hypothetical protein